MRKRILKSWGIFSVLSTIVGIGGWPDDTANLLGWFGSLSPQWSGFLVGLGLSGLVFFVLILWGDKIDTWWESPEPSPAEPISSPAMTASKSSADRQWCTKTPKELVQLVSGKTDFAAENAIRPFVGQWMTARGTLLEVESIGEIRVRIDVGDDIWFACRMKKRKDNAYFASLSKGDDFSASGKLRYVTGNGVISLEQCEIVT